MKVGDTVRLAPAYLQCPDEGRDLRVVTILACQGAALKPCVYLFLGQDGAIETESDDPPRRSWYPSAMLIAAPPKEHQTAAPADACYHTQLSRDLRSLQRAIAECHAPSNATIAGWCESLARVAHHLLQAHTGK